MTTDRLDRNEWYSLDESWGYNRQAHPWLLADYDRRLRKKRERFQRTDILMLAPNLDSKPAFTATETTTYLTHECVTPKQAISILTLPTEIRHQIWKNIIHNQVRTDWQGHCRDITELAQPSFTLACRQIQEEALPILFRSCCFFLDLEHLLISPAWRHRFEDTTRAWMKRVGTASRHIRTLHLGLGWTSDWRNHDGDLRACLRISIYPYHSRLPTPAQEDLHLSRNLRRERNEIVRVSLSESNEPMFPFSTVVCERFMEAIANMVRYNGTGGIGVDELDHLYALAGVLGCLRPWPFENSRR